MPVPTPARLVATDLDGTLLRDDGTVSARTRAALRAAVAAGLHLVVVTARPPRYLDRLADELDLRGEAICANGAVVYDLGTRRWQTVGALARPVARRVVAALSGLGVGFAVETGERMVYEPGYSKPDNGDVRVAVSSVDELLDQPAPIVKLLAWSPVHSADELLAAAQSAVGDEVECTHSGGRGLLELSAPGVSKVAALRRLCTGLGVAAAEVVAFGDAPNDLAMLAWAGTAYPVASAHPSLLAAFPRRTASPQDDGVAIILEVLAADGAGGTGR